MPGERSGLTDEPLAMARRYRNANRSHPARAAPLRAQPPPDGPQLRLGTQSQQELPP